MRRIVTAILVLSMVFTATSAKHSQRIDQKFERKLNNDSRWIIQLGCYASPARGGYMTKEPKSESALDFSGIDRFWEIYETLVADSEPSVEQWDKLFATPGYAALEERERRRKMVSEAFRLAYMPSKRAQLGETLKQGTWVAYVIPHLQKIPFRRADLTAFKTKLQHINLLSGAAKRTQTILPSGLVRRNPPPPVSFIFSAPDGRGYPKIIVVDLLNLMLYPNTEKFFAHELFHFYRRYVAVPQKGYAETDAPLMEILTNASEEGIADQMDKRDVPFVSEQKLKQMFPDPARLKYYEDYKRLYGESNEWLRRVEKELGEIARDPSAARMKGRLLQQQITR
jgi:hypothetical protein